MAADNSPVVTPSTRSVEQIEADLAASRERLTQTLGQLNVTVQRKFEPKHLMAIGVAKLRGVYFDEFGGIRVERVAVTVGVVVGVVVVKKIVT